MLCPILDFFPRLNVKLNAEAPHQISVLLGRLIIIALLALASGCADKIPVTGKHDSDPTFKGTQSESASAVSFSRGQDIFISTYNDDTDDGKVTYTATDRVVFPGASQLGWSYSLDRGQHWTYGGKVKPPQGIGALWGDPAIVVSRTNYSRVYISSLSIDDSKIPPTGHHGWMTDGTITGACVARSDDGGIHFAIQSCFSAGGDFYDGSALAAGFGSDQRIFAAFVDVPKDRIDVWASPDGLASFMKLGDPFPGMRMVSHPRLAYDQTNGALLVAAINLDNQIIYMNRLVGNTWQQPVIVSNATTRVDIKVGSQTIRMAYGFSFDVGASSVTELENENIRVNDDAIRLLYTTRDAETQRIYVRGSACRADLANCHDVPQWGTTPGNLNTPRDQWNPTVTAWQGFFGLPPVWKATYQTTDDDPNGVSIKEGNLAVLPNGTPIFLPFDLVSARIICPDFRNGSPGQAKSGYWGDYDEKALAGFSNGSTSPEFLLSFSDSSQGCISQSEFTSNHLHLSSVVFK
jgi:hypothetical protein